MTDLFQWILIAVLAFVYWKDSRGNLEMLDALSKWMVKQEEINIEMAEWMKERESTDGR